MIPVQTPDHEVVGLDDLIEQYKDKPVLEGLLRAGLRRIQNTEDAIFALLNVKKIDSATDAALDVFGAITGTARLGRTDSEYLAAIRLEVKVNRSNGRLVDMVEIATIANRNRPAQYTEYYPASFAIRVTNADSPRTIIEYLKRARPVSVPFTVSYTLMTADKYNHFASVHDPSTFDSSRWGSTHEFVSSQLLFSEIIQL